MSSFFKEAATWALAGLVVGALLVGGAKLSDKVFEPSPSATVQVLVAGGTGSGVQVEPGRILTAQHVVENNKTVQVRIRRSDHDQTVEARVLWTNKDNDVAMLAIDPKISPTVLGIRSLVCRPQRVGTPVVHEGHPHGFNMFVSRGSVATEGDAGLSALGVTFWPTAVAYDLRVGPGSSGGPVYTREGVVGIVVGLVPTSGISLIIPSVTVCGLIQEQAQAEEVNDFFNNLEGAIRG